MSEKLKALKGQIEAGRLLAANTFQNEALDVMLNMRDDVPFDSAWVKAYKLLERGNVASDKRVLVDAISELAFLSTYDLTQHDDLAAYVSDDFELIASAMALDIEDPWINGLWQSYKKGSFPYREVELVPGPIEP